MGTCAAKISSSSTNEGKWQQPEVADYYITAKRYQMSRALRATSAAHIWRSHLSDSSRQMT